MAQMTTMVAGELAGARIMEEIEPQWEIGPQWAKLPTVISAAVQAFGETAAPKMEAQDREWRRMARDRRGAKRIGSQSQEPHLPKFTRVADDQRREFATGNSDVGKEDKPFPEYRKQAARGSGDYQHGGSDTGR